MKQKKVKNALDILSSERKYRRSSWPILNYLNNAQVLFIIKYGKPLKEIQKAKEILVELMLEQNER